MVVFWVLTVVNVLVDWLLPEPMTELSWHVVVKTVVTAVTAVEYAGADDATTTAVLLVTAATELDGVVTLYA